MAVKTRETGQLKLHRNLSVWEAIGISLALMAPSMAASINPQGTATTVGRAVPLAFALAFVGVLLLRARHQLRDILAEGSGGMRSATAGGRA